MNTITVEDGCVVEVDGLPDGFDYEIIDKDTEKKLPDEILVKTWEV